MPDNRWTGPGTSDKYPRAIYSYSGWNGKNSTMYLTDGRSSACAR